jgi:uncharacterized protein
MIQRDLDAFGAAEELDRRMLHGGLPPFFLATDPGDDAYLEWMDSYWAKDLQELFVVEKKASFFKFVEILFRQSGGIFEAQSHTAACEVSRQTLQNYLQILETTLLATVLRPYAGTSVSELIRQPKVYMFDTGFVSYFRGVEKLRPDDRGSLLEHIVLGEMQARFPKPSIYFWRDKQKHEVDFILKPTRTNSVVAIECKTNAAAFDPAPLQSFRARHPNGENWLVCLDALRTSHRAFGTLEVQVLPYANLGAKLEALPSGAIRAT